MSKPREGTGRLPGEEAAVLTPGRCCLEVSLLYLLGAASGT